MIPGKISSKWLLSNAYLPGVIYFGSALCGIGRVSEAEDG